MRNILLAMAAVGALIPSTAQAAPVYLNCTFNGGAVPVKLTVDEQAGTSAVFIPSNGNSFNQPASFTADKIAFHTDLAKYELDRVTLALVRTVPRYNIVDQGSCQIERTPKRAV